ncbi:3-oxoadipate enol-lactonase [Acuticoccus sp.]|uniref:3-oxoadipate enol-lactonase n=1 Tax=Acuticoccus sp. TaxID=1904378 RepID=UPI003B525526
MHFINCHDVTLHAAHRPAAGGAPTLAFSNSLGTDLRVWEGVMRALPGELGVLRYDTRGHGLSDLAPADTAAIHAGDIAALADHFELDRLVVVGLSIGGVIATKFAIDHAARCAGLVLVCTGAKIGAREAWDERVATVRTHGIERLADTTMERWFSHEFRESAPEVVAGMRNMVARQPATGYAALAEMLRDADLTGELSRIDCPAHAIAGALDEATPPDLLRATAEAIRGASFVAFEGCAHMVPVEAPERTAAELTRFLSRHGLHG